MAKFAIGPSGKLLLVNGRPLIIDVIAGSGSTPTGGTTGLTLTPFQVTMTSTYKGNYVIQSSSSSNDTKGNVPFIFTYAGDVPTSVYARIVDASGNAVTGFDWTDITASISYSGTTCLGYLNNVPIGIDYKRQIRLGTSTTITSNDSGYFTIGHMLLPWGQSNMVGILNGGGGSTTYTLPPVPGTGAGETQYFVSNRFGGFFTMQGFVGGGTNAYGLGSWAAYMQGAMAMIRLVGNAMERRLGRKIGIAMNPWARNGTEMSKFVDTANNCAMLNQAGLTNGAIGFSTPTTPVLANGDYRIVLWHQGESLDWWTSTRAQRVTELKRFCQAHIAQVAKFGRPANKLTFLFAFMGPSSATHNEILRGAVIDLIKDPDLKAVGADIRIGWNCMDMMPPPAGDGSTGLHFADEMQRIGLRRMAQSAMNVLDPVGVPYGCKGPEVSTTYTRSGNDITLTITHEGGSNLAAKDSTKPITGWFANTLADFSGTNLVVNSVSVAGSNQVKLNITADTNGTAAPTTFYIKHCGNKAGTINSYAPDVSNLIYDNFVYPTGADPADQYTGLPILPTPDAIKIG